MKRFCTFTVVLLLMEICSVAAQDLIIRRDGKIIEARVMEISPTEIRYKRFDHLDGPTIVIPAANVLSIRYENGTSEIITAAPASVPAQSNTQPVRSSNTAIDQDKFIFGINANAGGAFNYIWKGPSGASVNFEFGKGNFDSEINLIFPHRGFGVLATFNGFWHSRIGGFYLGGGFGCASGNYESDSIVIGLNIGYKFVTRLGLYFRTGVFTGFDFAYLYAISEDEVSPFHIKPDLAIGWTMR